MFFDSPKKEAYKEGMTFEAYVKAALPKEGKALLAGKMPEMTLEGISIDAAALDTFRQHMVTVGTRVVNEKKEFDKAKKWLKDQHDGEVRQERAKAKEQENARIRKKERRASLRSTLVAMAIYLLFYWYARIYVAENPMSALRYISAGWAKAIAIIFTLFGLFISGALIGIERRKRFGEILRFIICATGVVSTIFLFGSLNRVAEGTYDISTQQEMKAARHFPVGSSFTLRGDVDMEGMKVKYLFRKFEGTFEGNGYTISNVEIKASSEAGLFRTNDGTIQNLTAENIIVNWKPSRTATGCSFAVGTIVARNNYNGNVANCTARNCQLLIKDKGALRGDTQAVSQQYVTSTHALGGVIGLCTYSCKYSDLGMENVTTNYYTVYSAISGPQFNKIGYRAD